MAAPDATAAGHVKLRLAAACAFNDHRGFRTPAEGAEPSVYLATLPDDGPSGILWGHIWKTDGTRRLRPAALLRPRRLS